jgi:transposase
VTPEALWAAISSVTREVVTVDVIVDRCAALDVHKDTVMACVRKPGPSGKRRVQEVREFRTWTSSLRQLRDWLAAEGVTQVAMEATGVYWRPVWHVLIDLDGVELMLCNAHHVKNLPGRKTDVADSVWLAQLLECGLLRGSFVPPPEIARLRDLTRYRTKLVQDRARETQRIQKLLEDAGVKLDSVVSDVLGKAARRMLDALMAGERDVEVMADMALTRMRPKIAELRLALEGRFDGHHALMLRMHLDHVDHLTTMVESIDEEVERRLDPFAEHACRLQTVPGIGRRTAEVVIAEIGVDMSRFPTAAHLASWAGLCPGNHESAGKRRSGKARKGNAALRSALCEAAWSAARTKDTYLAAQFRRFCRRFGKKGEAKAIFAVAHTMIVIVWHVLHDEVDYQELGSDWFERRTNSEAHARRLVRQLEKLGHRVTLEPAA